MLQILAVLLTLCSSSKAALTPEPSGIVYNSSSGTATQYLSGNFKIKASTTATVPQVVIYGTGTVNAPLLSGTTVNSNTVYMISNSTFIQGDIDNENVGLGLDVEIAHDPDTFDGVFIGKEAGQYSTATLNSIFIGYQSGKYSIPVNGFPYTYQNTCIGADSCKNIGDWDNVMVGAGAGSSAFQAASNVYVGDFSGQANASGNDNVSIGYGAGNAYGLGATTPTDYSRSVYIGEEAGSYYPGNDNIYIGYDAGISSHGNDKLIIGNNNAPFLITGDFHYSTVTINGSLIVTSSLTVTSSVTASAFFGDGSHLTGISGTDYGPSTASLFNQINSTFVYVTSLESRVGTSTNNIRSDLVLSTTATNTLVTGLEASTTTLSASTVTLFNAIVSTWNAVVIIRDNAAIASTTINTNLGLTSASTQTLATVVGASTTTLFSVRASSGVNSDITQTTALRSLVGVVTPGSINMSGSTSTIVSQSSISASAFFGYGGNLTGVVSATVGMSSACAAGFYLSAQTSVNGLTTGGGCVVAGTGTGDAVLAATQTWGGSNTYGGPGVTTTTIQGVGVVGTNSQIYGQFDVQGWTPVQVGSATIANHRGHPTSVVVSGRYLYTLDGNTSDRNLLIWDIRVATSPVLMNKVPTCTASANTPISLSIQGRYAYVSCANAGPTYIEAYDIINPMSVSPTLGFLNLVGGTNGMSSKLVADGKYVYTANPFNVIDASNPTQPVISGSTTAIIGNSDAVIYVKDSYAFVVGQNTTAGLTTWLYTFDVTVATSPITIGQVLVSSFSGTAKASDATVLTGNNNVLAYYDITGYFHLFDISTPTAVVELSSTNARVGANGNGLKISGKLIYVAGAGALTTWDITTPALPVLVSSVAIAGTSNEIDISGRYAYVINGRATTGASSLNIYDIGGAYAQSIEVGDGLFNTLSIAEELSAKKISIRGGLRVGGSTAFTGDVSLQNGISAGMSGTNMIPCGTVFSYSSGTVAGSTDTAGTALTILSTYTYAANTLSSQGESLDVTCVFSDNSNVPGTPVEGVYIDGTVVATAADATASDNIIIESVGKLMTSVAPHAMLWVSSAYHQTAALTAAVSVAASGVGIGQFGFDPTIAHTINCKASRATLGSINFVYMNVSKACK